ncbi:CPBP family intramembrane glutamic endopeptidase [Brevibacterium casei]|uniref:CPBP family intramembrane metalloprotease n=1 Tax=Brevibacterium casei TaxID=33889 RepID=A0A7T2TF42_9MICO|nr:CPBP family intramembrane glutamic endopeptidase [Brevibacterium casei]MBE4693683.1 CPBP family intramembrane metalloprotease [Brevibacterium casei]MBY3576806.1 CPBP family intramembrane metalloprotease [Brevibacterium casei]MCT2183029.1 CPBP family intramembrane metalloprotease [Brevibacterium casei]MCT2357823.1 CPBP family intramembrane metalloprotease [Brevibacterium casei]MDH5148780.1 lysostaphin resistance A-like protein [Brevibacterium casei]
MDDVTDETAEQRWSVVSLPGLSAVLIAVSAVILFGIGTDLPEIKAWGYAPLLAGVGLAWTTTLSFARDLTVIAGALALISAISVEADISWGNILRMGLVLSAVVVIPFLITRYWFKEKSIVYPRRHGVPWSKLEWAWLIFVVVVAWAVLPQYFIRTGVYLNWPAVTEWHEILRLFIGVNAVGLWDELFFICTVFALLRRHFDFWTANVLMSIIFVSFLWELGYRSIGPLLTIPFALVQAVIFTRTKSLPYTVTVHLLFDAIVFLTIVSAHHPQALPIFIGV